ncbi:MAG: Coenzyme F420 hydrogenase/dehydrogenase, beta subunit C-terminal domain [Planctomycetota bacterium]
MTISLPLHPLQQVHDGDYCSGCGACAYVGDGRMELNSYGQYRSQIPEAAYRDDRAERLKEACPFLSPELNEDALAAPRFAAAAEHDQRIGYHHRIYAARVLEGEYRRHATSGGVGTWLGVELMRQGLIDGVIHAKKAQRTGPEDALFEYAISRTEDEVRDGAKTRYHVVQVSDVMRQVRDTPGRYLFIGVPCMCKAVRRLQRLDPVLNERITFVAALICGHLKSVHWTLSLAWSGGIKPDEIGHFQHRTKGPDISARAYVFRAEPKPGVDKPPVQRDSGLVTGGKWNTCAMMLNACDYCDDVVGETADLTIGDAWLPKYTRDSDGTNLIVIRNPALSGLVETARDENRLMLDPISLEEAAASQSGGLRHRREGLSYRLQKKRDAGEWVPEKRVEPGEFEVTDHRKAIYDARTRYADVSRPAFRQALDADDYTIYQRAMKPHERTFVKLEMGTSPIRKFLLAVLGEYTLRRLLNFKRNLPMRIKRAIGRG